MSLQKRFSVFSDNKNRKDEYDGYHEKGHPGYGADGEVPHFYCSLCISLIINEFNIPHQFLQSLAEKGLFVCFRVGIFSASPDTISFSSARGVLMWYS